MYIASKAEGSRELLDAGTNPNFPDFDGLMAMHILA
jgi:hypothetical protein